MSEWTAEITNDSEHDYKLFIELLQHDEYVGRIYKKNQEIILQIYKANSDIYIPADWLKKVLNNAEKDLM